MSAPDGDEGSGAFPAPEFREYALGTLNVDHRDVHRHAGLASDPEVEQMITLSDRAYEPLTDDAPQMFWQTEFAEKIMKAAGTRAAREAIQSGNYEYLSFISGLVGYESDASGMRVLTKLQDLIRRAPVFITYIYGLMGAGKTDFAQLLIQVFYGIYGSDSVHVATNYETHIQDEQITHYSRLIEVLEDRHERVLADNCNDEFIMVIDEAAQIFTGSGSDQQRAKHLAKLLKLARKARAHIILIGQDGKDIGPSLRALCTFFVEKKNKKNASFYQDVKNRTGINEFLSLKGVPPTDIWFQTYDEGRFVFDVDEEDDDGQSLEELQREMETLEKEHERRMMAVLDITTDMTQREIGSIYGSSDKRVRRAKKKYGDEIESWMQSTD